MLTTNSFGPRPERDPSATAEAEQISPPGVTRQERLANQAELAGGSDTPAQGPAFIDGDSLGEATTL